MKGKVCGDFCEFTLDKGHFITGVYMNHCHCDHRTDFGSDVFVTNIQEMAEQNKCYRTALWTGCHLQMTLMSIPPCCDIGAELHPDMDQLIRIEKGNAMVITGNCPHNLNCEQHMCEGDAVFVPAGTWHNIKNTGRCPLKLSTIYAPPHHPFGTVEYTKEDA